MSKSFDIDVFKKNTRDFIQTWQKKFGHLSESVSRSGIEGATHWLKSHHQLEELKDAIEDLLVASHEEDFRLAQVETTLNSFILPEEDQGQAEWYKTADNLLTSFEKKLIEEEIFDKQLLASTLNELKFISQADDFHQRYQMLSIQQKVTQLYKELQQALIDFKEIEKNKMSTQHEQEKLKIAELENQKAQAEAKKVMMENMKIKEKRLAIIEEKKRKQAEKELLESQGKIELEQSELNAKNAEIERQSKLQDAYVDLQIEEKINNWSIDQVTALLQQKLENTGISSELNYKLTGIIEELNNEKSE